MVPQNLTPIPKDKVEQFQAMIDQLEDDDDVQEVYTAGDWPDD
jgi:transcriptional/translational regulatory protein YebC/TACO1